MKDLKWTHVVLIAIVLGVLAFLTYNGKDGAALIAGALALLGALGFVVSKQSDLQETAATIKDQTNGRVGELIRIVEQQQRDIKQMADKMAEMSPAPDKEKAPTERPGPEA